MKKTILISCLFLVGLLFLAGCKQEPEQKSEVTIVEGPPEVEVEEPEEEETIEMMEEACEQECTLKEVDILTSDGETYTLKPGKGGYTSAGALLFDIVAGQSYCEGEEQVQIKITKQSYGEVLEEEEITVDLGEESDVLTHPTVNLTFTLTVESVDGDCS